MRVIHIVPGKIFGGVETHLVTLARFRKLCPVMETHFGVCYRGRLYDEITATGATVHLLGGARVSRPWTVWRARRRLRDVLRRERIDIAICHMSWPQAVFGPAARAANCWSVIFLQNPIEGNNWVERWARRSVPDMVLGVSRDTARTGELLYPKVPAKCIYSPMPEFQSHSSSDVRQSVRQEVGTPEETTVFLQASRMDVWKGHHILLRAFGLLRELEGWVLWIAGGPQTAAEDRYFSQLRSLCEQLNITQKVRFLGQRRDVPRLMAAADVFCQANTGPEGFSWAFMEACAAGLPIVTTAIGGAPEIIDEANGRLVPPNDAEALARALQIFIGQPDFCREKGAAGRTRVNSMCDRGRQINKLHDILASLTGEGADSQDLQAYRT